MQFCLLNFFEASPQNPPKWGPKKLSFLIVDPIHLNNEEKKEQNAPCWSSKPIWKTLIACHLLNRVTQVSSIKCLNGM